MVSRAAIAFCLRKVSFVRVYDSMPKENCR